MTERPSSAPARHRGGLLTVLVVTVLGLGAWFVLGASAPGDGQARLRPGAAEETFAMARQEMIDDQLRRRGIDDPKVLAAVAEVPRHRFVPTEYRAEAYGDHPLPIGRGQTISQPYIVALMAQVLEARPGQRVLEIGTGSGYNAAVLSKLFDRVYSIEIVEPLGRRAAATLAELGYDNVEVRIGDGYAGWPEEAPFDAVILTAAPPEVPDALLGQVAMGGRLVAPLGVEEQKLVVLTRTPRGWQRREILPVRFVPMTGRVSEGS